MKTFIRWAEVQPGTCKLTFWHFQPETLTEEEMRGGMVIAEFPAAPDFGAGKRPVGPFLDPSTVSHPVDLKVAQTDVRIWYEAEDIPLTVEQQLEQLQRELSVQSPDQAYRELDKSAHSLDEIKAAKVSQLRDLCNRTILSGFTSSALGEPHRYGFDMENQANLTGMLAWVNADPACAEVLWKTEDAGPLLHSRSQFLQLCAHGIAHKNTNIATYWDLKAQVEAAATVEEVDAIHW